ncbi:hypothetical protein [Chryseobacterium sp. FH1]|uniref:hypothetical protein n=1 Tax=Chryseobacterium sp. FH1 TaxID=1233951 RepID=UPI0004E3A313|nr:hypothetical protein [Chryseobacterium sp. FH1]KFC20427.1 hypothetical protein IO90_14820 [Chryseobacterium sp. FH1]
MTYNINGYVHEESKNITADNYAEKINLQINHYNNEPIYYFRINKQNCLIRTYVNNINLYDDYELSNVITPIEIGNILKSGQQTVMVKMYPVGNLINEDLGLENELPATELSDKAKVDIDIVVMDNKSKKQFADERVIVTQVSPKEAAGKEYYEFSFTFNAEVPYKFEGWTKGKDLRKLDQDLVRKKAIEFYQMCGKIFEKNDVDAWLKLSYLSDMRIMSSSFVDKQYLDELVEEYNVDLKRDYNIQQLDNFVLEYMGNGKLLRLITDNQHPKLKGGGALLLNYGKGGVYQPGITLYLPEGRDLATQGFMMWK